MANEMGFPLSQADSMDCKMESDMRQWTKATDQTLDDGDGKSDFRQDFIPISMKDLQDMFEVQHEQLKAALGAELDKRLPVQSNDAKHLAGTLGSNLLPGGSQEVHAAIDIDQLLQHRADLTHEIQKLESKYKNARQRIVNLEDQIDKNADLAAQINAANEKNANLTQRMAALRQMLIPPSENQIIDSEIVRKFSKIRSGILTLVRQTWKTEIRPGLKEQDLTADQLKLFVGELTYDRLRSLVFSLIHKNIFGMRPYFLGHTRTDIEKNLRNVEKYLIENTPEDNESNIIAWRNATFKATKGLRDVEGDLSHHTRRHIWWFLMALQTISPAAMERGKARLQAVCDQAVELSMMIREAKDDIIVDNCENAVGTPISDHDGVMEEVTFAKADAYHRRGTVAYVICGALIKKPKDDLRQQIVLEKADVVVYH